MGVVCEENPLHPFYSIASFISIFAIFAVHEILNSIIVAVISVKLLHLASRRAKLLSSVANEPTGMSRELGATIVMFVVLLINVIVFFPMCVMEAIFHFNALSPETFHDDVESQARLEFKRKIGILHQLSKESLVTAHSLNFFVYLIRIPSFLDNLIKTFYSPYSTLNF